MSQYVFDIINNAAKQFEALKLVTPGEAAEYIIVGDSNPAAYYLACALQKTSNADIISRVSLIYEKGSKLEFFEKFMGETFNEIRCFDSLDEYKIAPKLIGNPFIKNELTVETSKTVFIFFTNLRDQKYTLKEARDKRQKLLRKYLFYAETVVNPCFINAPQIAPIDALPDNISGISEREYEIIYRDYSDESPQKMLLYLEDICREFSERLNIKAVRLDTLIGPYIEDDSKLCIQKYVSEIMTSSSITVSDNARSTYYSAAYIQDALIKIMLVIKEGLPGNIYNISSWHFNLFEIVYDLYTLFTNKKIELKFSESSNQNESMNFHILNPRKIKLIANGKQIKAMVTNLRKSVHVTALSAMQDYENYITEKVNVYYGKINRIRELELELVLEIDKICRENNIKYFLAGGSMLGAIRHKDFIPWDDDMDIGMLPEDYKKFVKVCPAHLSCEYSYQTTDLEPESLYIHDKIRVKNTIFSTRYANQFKMQNGVYIDVFVYYKTSDKPMKQKMHIRQILIMRRIMGMRWVNKPRKKFHYYKSLIMLPIMRLFPTTFYRHMYIKLLEKYEKKDTHYLIDGSGFNLKKVGAFPKEWFEDIIYKKFRGHSLPILKKYDDYLRHWYGEKYMELLPFSSRNSVHDVIRIDLGDKLFKETSGGDFHQIDFRGELYEKRKSEL